MKNYKLCAVYKGVKKGQKPSIKSDWYIFYYFNKNYHSNHLPADWKRIKIKADINRLKTLAERNDYASDLVKAQNELLQDGFNPFESTDINKRTLARNAGIFNLKEAVEWAMGRKEHFAHKTKIDFKSILKLFTEVTDGDINVRLFSRIMARQTVESMVKKRGLGDHAYIKYKRNLHNIFEELLSWEKIEYNPFDYRSNVRKPKPKAKRMLTSEQKLQIRESIQTSHPGFFNYLMMLNHTATRPVELLKIKVGDVDMVRREIILRSEDTKDKEDRIIIIPRVLDQYLNLKGEKEWYLFGLGFEPQERNLPLKRDYATKLWHQLVKVNLKIDSNMYWLKHLGLTARRMSGMDTEAVQLMAGHSSYDQTQSNYIPGDRPEIRKQIEGFDQDF